MPPTIRCGSSLLAVSFAWCSARCSSRTGMNLQPALVCRAFMFFAYPKSISGAGVWTPHGGKVVDAYTWPPPLNLGIEPKGDIIAHLSANGFDFGGFHRPRTGTSRDQHRRDTHRRARSLNHGRRQLAHHRHRFAGGRAWRSLQRLRPVARERVELPAPYPLVMGGFAFGAVFRRPTRSRRGTNAGKYCTDF